jgi:hypothetical protein
MTIYQQVMKADKEGCGIWLTTPETKELASVMRAMAQYKRTHNAQVTFGKKRKRVK